MEKKEKTTIIDVERENEALMQPGVVSEDEFRCFAHVSELYGKDITKTAQQVAKLLNGYTIDQANHILDLARYAIKYTVIVKL